MECVEKSLLKPYGSEEWHYLIQGGKDTNESKVSEKQR
jgi:hypothetical protein